MVLRSKTKEQHPFKIFDFKSIPFGFKSIESAFGLRIQKENMHRHFLKNCRILKEAFAYAPLLIKKAPFGPCMSVLACYWQSLPTKKSTRIAGF